MCLAMKTTFIAMCNTSLQRNVTGNKPEMEGSRFESYRQLFGFDLLLDELDESWFKQMVL